MKNIKLKERVALIMVVAMLITNPLTGQYVDQAIEAGFTFLFRNSSYVAIVGTVYLLGLGVYYYIKINKLNIPAKTAKVQRAGKFIEA